MREQFGAWQDCASRLARLAGAEVNMEILMLALLVAFVALTVGLARGCERLVRARETRG